jgi:ribosome-associated protein
MAEPIVVTPGVVVPAAALSLHTSRSSGPGGQNVNKVASKVELRVDLDRRDADGWIVVVSQRTRDQHRNLEDAREKVRALVRRAMIRPRTRRPTRATAASKARRLDEKKRRSGHKRGRGPVRPDED